MFWVKLQIKVFLKRGNKIIRLSTLKPKETPHPFHDMNGGSRQQDVSVLHTNQMDDHCRHTYHFWRRSIITMALAGLCDRQFISTFNFSVSDWKPCSVLPWNCFKISKADRQPWYGNTLLSPPREVFPLESFTGASIMVQIFWCICFSTEVNSELASSRNTKFFVLHHNSEINSSADEITNRLFPYVRTSKAMGRKSANKWCKHYFKRVSCTKFLTADWQWFWVV